MICIEASDEAAAIWPIKMLFVWKVLIAITKLVNTSGYVPLKQKMPAICQKIKEKSIGVSFLFCGFMFLKTKAIVYDILIGAAIRVANHLI